MTPEWARTAKPAAGRQMVKEGPGTIFEMVQDLADDAGLGDERNDVHLAAALVHNSDRGR